MNDLIIKVSKRSRLIDLDHSVIGIVGENLQEKLVFTFQDEFVDGMARLEYELDGEKRYVLMEKVSQSYILPVQNVLLTKEGNIDLQLVITEDKTGTPVFKSEVFTLYCKKSIEAVGEAPSSYELWIETANRILLEASRVNIDGKKTGNETIITITQRDGNKKSFPIQDGEQGPQGPQGPVGPQGPQGPEGPVGPTPDLSDYVKNTDYATTNKGGVIKVSNAYATTMSSFGTLNCLVRNFNDYESMSNGAFVSKGTLENVITGKQLINQSTLEDSQAEQDTTIEGLQAELDRYKLLENALPHTENETASDYVTLENTAKSPMEVSLTPQTSQDGEPTPDNPQEIHRTTGENQVKVTNSDSTEETTYPLSLGDKEMFNINGVYDGFVYDESVDKFYFRRWNRKIELPIADMNNSENYPGWTSVSQFKADYPSGNDSLFNLDIHYFSNICKQTEEANDYFGYNSTGNGLLFLRRNRWGTDYTQTYWKTNYPNLIVDLVYNLKTYVDEEITDTTLISQLRAIKDALSMQGTTHIISTSSGTNLPFLIKARAVQTIERT